jgi:molybdate transport system substrate-binding protein
MQRFRFGVFGLGLSLVLLCAAHARRGSDEILVSAAASLTDAFTEVGRAYDKANPGTTVRFNFASSGALQRQIEQGAPVDVFASASPKEMDALQRGSHIEESTRLDFASNRLVLIVPEEGALRRWEDLRLPSVHRVALANPDSVPAGRYAKETLTRRSLWGAVQPKSVFGENVRQTLAYVASGDADAGVVFATDAQLDRGRVRVAQQDAPGGDHSPILYPAAVVRGAPNEAAARRFVDFLRGPVAQGILARFGFASAIRSGGRK